MKRRTCDARVAHLQIASTLATSVSAVLRSLALAAEIISARNTSICACLCCVMSAMSLFSSSESFSWNGGTFETEGRSKLFSAAEAESATIEPAA